MTEVDASRSDETFQDLMAALGEAKADYDLVVREVEVIEQPDRFTVPRELYDRWRDASRRLRTADDALLEFLSRSAA